MYLIYYSCRPNITLLFCVSFWSTGISLQVFGKSVCFFVCWLKFLSDLTMISLSSVMNIWVWPALSLSGNQRGAGPLPGTLKVRLAMEEGVEIYNAAMFYFTFTNSSSRKILHLRLHSQRFAVKWSFHASSDCHHSFFIVRSCEFLACCLINFQL